MRLYKYRSFTTSTEKDRLRDIIENQRVYCPTPDKLNDPYDCNIGTADHLLSNLVNLGIFSASAQGHDEILLFSYYAGEHTGVCLEFEVDQGSIGELTFLGQAEPVEYIKDFPLFSKETIHRLPWTKYQVWRHEKEYRAPANLDFDSSPYRCFKKEELVGIRFGLRMKSQNKNLIKEWVEAINLPNLIFQHTTLRKDSFGFEYQNDLI